MKSSILICALLGCSAAVDSRASAATVALQQATATFSQSFNGDFSVARAINGTNADSLGWAIHPNYTSQVAAFETTSDVGDPGGSLLTFTLTHARVQDPGHLVGRFRLSLTTDGRSTFADGLAVGGDVVANWTVLDPITTVSANGSTLTEQPDGSILASGLRPSTDVYTITTTTNLTGITGFRLEVIADPSLPNNGPGRFDNGNFVLSEFGVDIQTIPEPAVCTMLLVLVAGGLLTRCRRTACG